MQDKKKYQNGAAVSANNPQSSTRSYNDVNTPNPNKNIWNYINQYSNYQQLSPFYTPNPAFNTGLTFGVNASPGAKVGATMDLLSQSFLALGNKLQPFFNQNQTTQQTGSARPQQATMAQNGYAVPMTNQGMYQDPTQMYPNQVNLDPNNLFQSQLPQQPFIQPQSNFPIINTDPLQSQYNTNDIRAERNTNNMGAANVVGASAATLSFGMDLAKGIAGGIGVGRRSQYNWEQAQERLRNATINQGYEKDRRDLFNQGYLQTTGYFQDGGNIPVSMDGLNQFPNQPVIVPSNNINMQGIPYDVMAYPNGDPAQLMKPNQNYNFPNSTQVLEQPILKNGGMIEVEKGIFYNTKTQEFIYQ